MIKRKGQIVPRWLVKAVERKSQHVIKFGCDVQIVGNKITSLNGGGTCVIIPNAKYCDMKKNKRRIKGFEFKNLMGVGFDTFVKVEGQTRLCFDKVYVP